MLHFDVLKAWIQAHVAKTDRGASLVEYALLVALIAVVCIVAITFLGSAADQKFSEVGSELGG
ncbi:Flp family type IVb pilin [Acidimicrobiia bacterium EGI L10123]|uniref:Flp family type IVb pilin n=1 Tax=Salinilacustrithrix flava TaxID=2957203 RepID=UPI003D7C2257|nr:Flp family type IVb pilin [Acidimicrobiia bacterium EGI L10123]